MLLLSLLLTLPSFAADSLACGLSRAGGGPGVEVKGELVDGAAQAASPSANELGLGLDASLSPQSLFLVLEDSRKQTRTAFTASPNGASEHGFVLGSGESHVRCAKRVENPPKVMPARPQLPEYFVCVLDELRYAQGSVAETKRLGSKAISTALFRLPAEVNASFGAAEFRVKLNRMDFLSGLAVELRDKASGHDARFTGPASTLHAAFLIGLTIGDRAREARFLRLGCTYANAPNALN